MREFVQSHIHWWSVDDNIIVHLLSDSQQLQTVSLPVQQMMITVQVKLAELLINVSLEDLNDQQQQQHSTSRRCIEQVKQHFMCINTC